MHVRWPVAVRSCLMHRNERPIVDLERHLDCSIRFVDCRCMCVHKIVRVCVCMCVCVEMRSPKKEVVGKRGEEEKRGF